ncbi:MAG TPA: hypothetical protein VHC49_17065 [Mycobacteriales bacterium]|nr:hypothetical protein [Mycobacteriales bacterium]
MRDWLRRQGRVAWLLVIIPVIAAVAGVAVGMSRHPGRTATATVLVTASDGSTSGASLTSATSGFVDAIDDDPVLAAAAKASGVPADQIKADTSAARVGDTAKVKLVYKGDRRGDAVTKLLQAQAQAAITQIYDSSRRMTDTRVSRAQARVDTANRQLDALRTKNGVADPGESYRLKSGEVTSLRVALVTAESRGENTAPIQAALDDALARMNHYSALEVQYSGPQSDLTQARASLDAARDAQDQLAGRMAAATAGDAISVGDVKPAPKVSAVLRLGVSAAVVGFVLAAALLVGLALLRRETAPAAAPVRRQELRDPAEGRA